MNQEQWEMPLRERVAVIEADNRTMKEAVLEIRDAISSINTTLQTVVRVEEKTLNLAENDIRIVGDIKREIDDRKEQAATFGSRIGKLEKETSELKTLTELNSHGRTMFERLIVPVIAGIFSAVFALSMSSFLREESTTDQRTEITIPRTQENN